ncbi:MAG: 30S ribosomal protein S6, partial [Dehalococcoidia bacterium]|nr:30S ribosomal protein S6 [Dehalococcoidia bacterium]
MANYEMVYVLNPTIMDDQIEEAGAKVANIVASRGGTVTKNVAWGRRRLAYPLQDHREGIYFEMNFSAETH